MTGNQFLEYFRSIRNTDLPLLQDLLNIFELPLNRKIKGYSRGMKQKMGIIQAFMDDPEIVIMDEPTSGLDPLLQQKFYSFLREERTKGRTIFFSSHILSEVDKICDRVGIIRNGQLVALEDIETLKQKTGKKIRVKMKEDPTSLLSNDTVTLVDGWIEITVQSNPDKWLKKLSQYTILDLEVKEFSLEDYFMRYYIEGTGA
jgi:ABC-2 type transport system ATP-binding protein